MSGRIISTLLFAVVASGCFTMRHDLPPGAHFGRLPGQTGAQGTRIEQSATKNYALAGFLPYSDFNDRAMLGSAPANGSLQIQSIETTFTPFDVFISIIPGAFYGYYIWAPRTLHIVGSETRGASD